MKFINLLVLNILAGYSLLAQNQGPVQLINRQMTGYFIANPREKVFIATDKTKYKPGETIWFRVFDADENNLPDASETSDLLVKLFDASGNVVVQDLFRLNHGSASCDLALPADLPGGICFLCAYTSSTKTPQDVPYTMIRIYTAHNKQWIAEIALKDSISTAGKSNEIRVILKDLSGEVQKNTAVRYQLMNGIEISAQGKLKTDASGKIIIPFNLPAKTNGEPFTITLSDNKGDWEKEVYLPSNLDSVFVSFYPEGGNLVPGTISKVGFTAFNKLGIPVDVEGTIQDQEGKSIAKVQTFTRGLGLFSLDNILGQRYRLVLTGAAHRNQIYDLPLSDAAGLALSVVKGDAEFITSNLVFADKLKHAVTLLMTNGSTIIWAADMDIDAIGRIKIPKKDLPQGINLLTVFSKEGSRLAERIVYVDKKQELKISVQPEKTNIMAGEKIKLKIRLSDENNKPLAGNISVAVSDQFWLEKKPFITESLLLGLELETPLSLITSALKGKITNNTLLDVFLISTHLKGFDWSKISSFKTGDERERNRDVNLFFDKKFDEQLAACLKGYSRRFALTDQKTDPDPAYFSNNEILFQKIGKTFKANSVSLENQRKMFESSTSILDVIKTIKPYKILNNMIVFYGSENSFNFQGGALIVMDGQQMGTDISALSSMSPLEIDHINVSTNPMDIQKYTGLNSVGVIEIYRKGGRPKEEESVKGAVPVHEGKYRIPGQFPANPSNSKRDYRTTLQWIPEQKVDSSGEFEFSVTAGKVVSDYIIEVNGMDANGLPGRGEGKFSVISPR